MFGHFTTLCMKGLNPCNFENKKAKIITFKAVAHLEEHILSGVLLFFFKKTSF